MPQEDIVSGVPFLIGKDEIREPIRRKKDGKTAGSSDVVSEMVNPAGEIGCDIIIDLVIQFIVEGVGPLTRFGRQACLSTQWGLNLELLIFSQPLNSLGHFPHGKF